MIELVTKKISWAKNEVNDEITVIKIKIMNYENKYNDALEKLQEALAPKDGCEISGLTRGCIEEIFPELKESEDEKIRKEIIATIHLYYGEPLEDEAKEMISWLEKQGKQKTDIPKWKYKKDNAPLSKDCLILNRYGCVVKSVSGAIVSDAWVLDYDELAKLPKEEVEKQEEKLQGKTALEAIKEEKVDNANKVEPKDYSSIDPLFFNTTDKVEPKFKVGDWVVISTTKGDRVVQIASVEYFTKDGHSSYITTEGRWFGNGTEARLLTDKDVEIATIPESKAIVNKIESWSEEDEKNLKRVIWYVENPALNVVKDTMLSEWLKSIKERVQPQPKQ